MRRTKSGFTLIELLIVILIAGILTGWVVPDFRKFIRRMKLENSSREAMVMLRTGSRQAITKRRTVNIWVYTNKATLGPKNTMRAEISDDCRDPGDGWTDLPAGRAEMISPVTIEYLNFGTIGANEDFNKYTMYGTSGAGAKICMTYLNVGEVAPTVTCVTGCASSHQHTDGAEPALGPHPNTLWHNTIEINGLQRAILYKYMRGDKA